MKEKRKRFIQIFAIALIMLLIASSTYAYFASQYGQASSTDITVTTSTVDNLTFETGEAISISATQSNFTEGSGNQSGSTYASATLVANNDTNSASANYYLYIKIDTNEFEYTTADKTAELILTITDPDGNLVTSLSGLTYTSVVDGKGNTISGFDITSKIGLITIADNYLIESTGINIQEWNITVTLVNLDSDQSGNAGKSFSASLVIQSSVYGNTLQAASWNYSDEIWAYRSSITKIVFDDNGSTISDYEELFDITDDGGYCYYDGIRVSSYSGNTINESDCKNIYKLVDTDSAVDYSYDYSGYYSDELINTYLYNDSVSVSWDSETSTCVIDSLNSGSYSLYLWHSGGVNYTITENECIGQAYQWEDSTSYYLGIEYVGSGEWTSTDNNYSSIQAYLVNNGDSTYTVYIESDAPILGNEDMSYWFYNFTSLESIEGLDKLITSNVTDMEGMFYECSSLTTLDLSMFDTSNVTDMSYLFYYCYSLKSLDLSNWDTSNVTDMSSMFHRSLLSVLNLDGWDTSNVKDMSYMFYYCYNLTTLDLSSFDTSNVTDMALVFAYCNSLTSLDLSNFDTSNVTTMQAMFQDCVNLTELDLSTWNTSNVTDMDRMFAGCSNLTSLNLSSFDTSNVTDMSYMFHSCYKLTSLDLSKFDTSSVENTKYMFYYTFRLTTLDLSNADFSNVTTYSHMFGEANSSITVTVKDSDAYDFITARLSEYNGGTVVIA